MPITVPCAKCKTRFQVPSKLAGTTVRCKNCGTAIRLPSPDVIQAKKRSPGTDSGKPAGKTATHSSTPAKQQSAQEGFFDGPLELLDLVDTDTGPSQKTTAGTTSQPSTEPTVLSCSHCEGLLYYDPNYANQTVACPHCGNHLVMPEL